MIFVSFRGAVGCSFWAGPQEMYVEGPSVQRGTGALAWLRLSQSLLFEACNGSEV